MRKHGTAFQVTGWYVEFQMAVLRALPRDIDQRVADGWRENGKALTKNLRSMLIPPAESTSTHHVTVDYILSLEEMIKVGRYQSVNPSITSEHFPIKGKGTKEVETKLVHFDRFLGSDEVIQELDKDGLRPAIIEELLAFGSRYPMMQWQFPIVALGSILRRPDHHQKDVPYLWGRERHLDLVSFESLWHDNIRFLTVLK